MDPLKSSYKLSERAFQYITKKKKTVKDIVWKLDFKKRKIISIRSILNYELANSFQKRIWIFSTASKSCTSFCNQFPTPLSSIFFKGK